MERKWWLVIAGCITHAVNTGFSYFGMSAFFPSFEREFGWSRTAISGAFSLARVESGLLGPIEGYLTDRVGAHRMLFIGLILCSLGFITLSLVDSLPMLYGVIILGIVLGSSLGYNMPISVLIAKLFRERRSLAFGVFRMGPGISGPLVPLVGWMIGLWGWRAAAVISGIIIFSVGLPIACFIYRIYLQEEAAISSFEAREHASSDNASFVERSTVHVARGDAIESVLVFVDGDGAAPYGHRRRVGTFRHSSRRSRLEHGGCEQLAWSLGADRRARAPRHGLARRSAR